MNLADLTQVALLGTGSQPPPPVTGEGALARLLRQLDASRKERSFLAAVTLVALHERVATLPARHDARLPAPCPPESRPWLEGSAAMLLLRMLSGDHRELLPECLRLMHEAGRVAPPELVPALLDAGASQSGLREAILAIAGTRGPWLAAMNDTWAWASGGASEDAAWQEGTTQARARVLRRVRAGDPAAGLQLLSSSWTTEAPDERAALLAELATGLGTDDEAFLEAALDDRRKEVRRLAASLLARLPGSAFVTRMTARVLALLVYTPGTPGSVLALRRAVKPRLEVTLPSQCDEAMRRDGIEPKPPQGTGEKAWWLLQMIASTPPAAWTSAWSTTPGEILRALEDGDFEALLVGAFTQAACAHRDAAWAGELAERAAAADASDARRRDLPALILALGPEAREARVAALLRQEGTLALAASCVEACDHAWSAAFSRDVLGWLRRAAAGPHEPPWVRSAFENVALRLASSELDAAPSGWPADAPSWPSWSRHVDALLATAHARAALHSGIHGSPREPSPGDSP